ncbi:MAG: GerMN domain-containing protein, partial [Synergistaceae bacterium]
MFNWADKKGGPRVGDVVGSPAEVKQVDGSPSSQGETITSGYSIYLPDNGKYTKREVDITKGTIEADAAKVLSVYIDGLKETNTLDSSTRALNVFIGGDCMYLDMSPQFLASLKKLGTAKAPSVLNGMTKTMRENFSPVKKIKFYIEGKESNITSPVDLTKPWEKTE